MIKHLNIINKVRNKAEYNNLNLNIELKDLLHSTSATPTGVYTPNGIDSPINIRKHSSSSELSLIIDDNQLLYATEKLSAIEGLKIIGEASK